MGMKEKDWCGILPPGYLEYEEEEMPSLPGRLKGVLRGKRACPIHGAVFSPEEYASARKILMSLADCLRQHGALAADYDSYAKWGMAEVYLWEVADAQLFSEEQIQAILRDYQENLRALLCRRISQGEEGQALAEEPYSAYYLVRWENGHRVPYPTVAWDKARIKTIYETFATGAARTGRETFLRLVRPAVSSLMEDEGAVEQRLADYLAGMEAFQDSLDWLSCQFLQPFEPEEEF